MATQTVEQVTRLPEFQEKFLADILAQAKAASQAGMPYAPSQVAELGAGQQQAIQQAMSGVGAYAPYLQAGQAAVGQGITGAQQACQVLQGAGIGEHLDPLPPLRQFKHRIHHLLEPAQRRIGIRRVADKISELLGQQDCQPNAVQACGIR